MSADTSNYSQIQDEDVLRKMWQDTDDFGKKKEIRSHMYKLREQRLREFYNGSEISESKTTTTSGKITQSSTHTDSLVDQSFQSFKSKEVRDSESPTREIQYKVPDKMASKEWQVESSKGTSLDGKTKMRSSVATVEGTQKIEGGQIDFRAKSEKMSNEFRDANEYSSTNRSQTSASSRMVTSSSMQPEHSELPSNLHGVTKVIRETKTLPDGSTVTTTRYDTSGGSSQFTSQSSTSSRHTSENIISSGSQIVELPEEVQELTKINTETKTLPYVSTITSKTCDNVSDVAKNNLKTAHTTSSKRVINEKESLTTIAKETKTLPDNQKYTTTNYDAVNDSKNTIIDDTKTIPTSSSILTTKSSNVTNPELPNNIQGVTKVTKETKTLPDGSIMTITKYDTPSGTTTHSEIIGNVKISKDHSSVLSKSYTDEAITTNNRQSYKKQEHDRQVVNENRHTDMTENNQYSNTDNKITVVSTTEKTNKDQLKETVNVTKQRIGETDGNKMSPTKVASKKQPTNLDNDVENVTITKQYKSDNVSTNSFINKERQQEEVTRDKNICEVVSSKVDDSPHQEPRVKETSKPDYHPSKPTTGQYDTTYKTDYTSRKISVDVSPTHDAFARSLRAVSPDRVPSRGSHRTSNSSIAEKMRHPSRISPERQPKDRSISPTKSISTDTYIYNKKGDDNQSHRKISSTTDNFKKTVSQETITITKSKQNTTNKSTNKNIITTSNEIVTDLDEDLIKTTEKSPVAPGSRPTSLELTRKPKKITDRSPSSPLTDTKKSPTKEIRRSSSFRSPTKEPSSPTKASYPRSPTKDTPSTKNLPEDRHLKRTDTYEERCRQILGITEVTEKRKSSLERSGSKRNSLRRNISSQLVDTIETITSPSKSPTKERPVSPTKSKSPTKERPVSPTKSISPTKERLLSPTKERPLSPTKSNSPTKERPLSPTKERPLSPTKERPLSPTKSNSPIKDRSVSPTKSQSPVKERPISPTKEGTLSPTKGKIPLKERTMSPTKSLTKEKLESSTKESPEKIKSPVKDRPESPTKSRDDIDYAEITTTFTRETAYNREDQDISPIKNRPLSPTKGNQISSNEDRLSSIVTSIKTDTLISTTNRDETVITNENKESIKQIDEFTPKRKNISSNKNTNENVIESTVITSEYDTELIDSTTTSRSKSTKKPGNKKVSNQTSDSPIKSKQALVEEKNTDKVVLEDIINIEETITTDGSNYISKYKTSKKTSTDEKPQRKDSHPKEEFPTQSKMPSKHPSNNINTTSKFISQEKISTDIHSSMEVIVDEDDVKNISETEYDKIPISKKAPKTAPTSDLPKTKKVTKNISEEIKSTVGMDNNRNNTTDKSPRGSEKENIKPKGKLPSDKEKSVTEVEAREIMIIVDTDNKIQSTGEVSNQQKEESNDFIRTEQVQREVEDKNICYKKSTTDTKINESEVVTPKTSPQSKQVINKSGENIKKSIISKDDEETIIDEFVVTDESDNPKIIMGKPVPKDTKPIKKGKETLTESVKINAISKQDDTVIVTDEFEIVNKPNQQPLKNELGITEYPPQSKKTISKKISQEKITPKSKPVTQKPKPSEFPSQIKKDKRPVNKEPIVTEKFFEPISYENKVPVEEPLMIKKHINPHCREDEVEKTEITKTTTSKKVEKSTQKELPINKQKEVKKIGKHTDKNTENSIQRKPINGISEYKDQYSKPKPTPKGPSNKIKNTIQETTKIIHKNYDEISPARNKPITKPLVNGIQKPKETPRPSKPSAVTVNSAKVTKLDTTETVTRRTNKIIVSKENMSPLQKSKKEIGMKNPVKLSTVTKNKSSQPDELITKKHVVTTTITLEDNRQPITTKPKLTTKITKSERNRVTDLKQKHINEYVSTDTDDEKIEENVEITRRTINKKPEKKCITTKTVIINNNGEQRQVIVDLQRSKSSREPTPDRICPVPTSNGEYQFPRYPDEILEPDDDEIRKKPKRLSDIPLMESEDVNDFSRITEITDTKVVTDIDKVEETDESLLSVNKKINLFLDNVDRVKQVKNKPLGPAPKVERPKLDVSEGLESDECLLSVSEKVTKFVNAADQFMNVRDIPERPKSPRCKNYDEKNTTETFIKTEQKNLENQSTNLDTGKISLNSLEKINNKISKDSKPNSENRVPSPTKFKPTLDTIDKSEQKHPKYNTITKKISLENLEIKSSVKTSENVVKPSPEKLQSRDTITTTETRETRTGSRDFSPEDKGYKNRLTPERRSPDRKSPATNNKPETPVKRPSNEYGSIKHIKTQDKISTNRDHSLVDDTTPKKSKANIVEDKKTFLSSTGRLRSTESIKKARAIFENISKEQEPTKSPLKNKSVSKKLNYTEDIRKKETTSEIDRAPLDRNTTVYSPDSKSTDRNVTSSFDVYKTNGDLPHYMLPLHRNEETHDKITHESRTVKTKSDIISTTRNISRSNSPDSLSESSDVPHYMLPLDRSVHTHSTPRASQHRSKSPEEDRPKNRTPEVHSKTGDVPHYMLPLKHDIHTHSHETNSVTRESRTKFQATGRDNSPDVRSETDDIPHYRLPLERSVHTTTSEMKDTRFRSKSPERTKTDKPHYMLPLDHHVTITTTRVSRPTTRSPERDSPRNRSPENQYENIPHYRLPIDRSVHTHTSTNIIKESKSGRYSSRSKSPEDRSESGDVPHYMLPLDRSINPDKIITSSTRDENKSPVRDGSRNRSPDSKLETDDIPHYRLPLDRDVHVHTTTSTVRESRSKTKYPERPSTRSRSPDNRSETGDVPHYMLPLDRNVHPDKLVDTSITRDSRHRSKSPQTDSSRNRTPDNRSETGDVPHYMLPLDRSVHPDRIVTNSTRDETNSPVRDSSRNRLPDSKIEADDIPHYRLPLDRDVHFHTTTSKIRESKTRSPERHSTRSRSPEDRSETGDVPHYMLPLDRNVHPDRIVATNLTRESRHRTKSPQTDSSRNISPEDRSETGDIPHYMLPLDRNVHPDSPTRDGTKSPERCSQRNRSPDGRSETSDVPHYMLPLDKNSRPHSAPTSNIDTRATKFGITLRKVNIGSPVSKPSKPSLHKLPSETKFVNIESITEEDIEDIFDLEILEELLQKIEIYELRKMIRTQIRLIKSLISENTLTTYIKERRQLKSKQETITKKSSYTRKYSDQNIETRKTTSRNTSPEAVKNISPTREITRKPDNERSSPERTGARETIKTTTTTTTRYSPTRQQSPSRYSSPNHPISGKTEVTTEEIIRKSSPERITKTKVTETSTKTEQTRKLSTEKSSTTTVSSTERRNISHAPDKSSPKLDTKTGYSILKKTEIHQKKIEDDKPEWVKQRNLKKVSSPNTNEKISTNVRRTVKEENRIITVGCEPTDSITSSYGVGPTDENGTPLFGLKALRTQHNGTTKVQGTFVKSEYYSENGNAPVGQISVTKYSTDPRDLSTEEQIQNNDLITSVTTTQQFGYENTPSLETLTNKKGKQIEDTVIGVNKTSNFKRQNSVKALSQKFIDTAVDSLKNERQTSYPKAGLILRTSSFKESKSAPSEEDIPTDVLTATKTSKKTTTTTTTSGGTFLSNKSTISGVQDVITRMKTEEYQEGDTSEDIEAKSLLNKFIGSQVILSGMENRSTSIKTSKTSTSDIVPTTSSARKTIKITTTATEGGKTKTKTLVFQSPITEEELENIWDDQTLRLLLEQSTQYEERRVIRNRLRTVMAEQEACAELVEKASQDPSEGKIEGESLLLPLLQGLLQAPEKDQTADSGTESGEDQRNSLIAEVQNALDKLSQSLCRDSTDISEERRSSLLYLVTKLQAGLSTAVPKLERRLSSEPGRFNKRKNRQNRHTVGVSSEELADARRLMEEISGHTIAPSNSHKEELNLLKQKSETNISNSSNVISVPKSNDIEPTILSKQNSDSSVTSNRSINKYLNKSSVKNTTPKPFGSSNNSISNNSSTAQTPDIAELFDVFFTDETPYEASKSLIPDTFTEERSPNIQPTIIESGYEDQDKTKPLQYNPVYTKPDSSYLPSMDHTKEQGPRFNTEIKKQKMKRANTIDIPKPLHYYEESDDSDGETEAQQHKNNYYALRGPIRVGNPINKKPVPTFEPKTATDQKFLAFLNKNQNSDAVNNKSTAWTNQKNRAQVWENRFGNIKNNFENVSRIPNNTVKNFWKTQDDAIMARTNQFGPKISRQSARNLQQMFEEKRRESQERIEPPQVQRVSKEILPVKGKQDTITGKLSVKTEPEKNYKLVPGPLPVNKFSHAPQSAFKPIPKRIQDQRQYQPNLESQDILKTEIKENNDTSLFLYSPKPLYSSESSSPAISPNITKPWLSNDVDKSNKVISITAKKFEAASQQNDVHVVKPRKLSRELTSAFISPTPKEKPTTSYLPRNDIKSSTVRKLSDQYNNIGSKAPEYSSHTSVTYQPVNYPRNHHSFTAGSTTNIYGKPHQNNTTYNQSYLRQKSLESNVIKPQTIYQHVPGKEDTFNTPKNVYTSTLTFNPNIQNVETINSPPKLQTQLSNESVHEYTAINSKVMGVPVSQQAVTIRQKSPMTRNEHDMAAAFSLKKALTGIGKGDNKNSKTSPIRQNPSYNSLEPTKINETYNNNFTSKVSEPKTILINPPNNNDTKAFGVVKPMQQKQSYDIKPTQNKFRNTSAHNQQFVEINEKGQGVVTSKFHIPIVNVEPTSPGIQSPSAISPIPKGISKSDSWHQICMASQSPTRSPPTRNVIKSKSSHSLAVPQRQFEAGMSKDELVTKKKAMEAYLIGGASSLKQKPNEKIVKTSINRKQTSEKQSAFKSTGISRSRTLPDIVCPPMLDESNVDQAFEDLFKSKNVSVEKTTTKNPTATTTTVTKVTTQQQITKKPLSPFAKFQQLDKQNSLNTPPGTPGTPKSPGNGPLFKFTDPAVSLSAATIKDRLLFWCRMKTKEYENVQLDNFSTSWADGLAFCALIHHFLPDAFDYHALTPKDRRHNFELAFRVASEKADIFPLLDVDDMMATRRPDWKCVFTYVQSVYRRFKDEEI